MHKAEIVQAQLLNKIADKTAVVSVIGLGYVGLPIALTFAKAGFQVLGIDNDPQKIEKLNTHQTYLSHITPDAIKQGVETGRLKVTTQISSTQQADVVILCLPTPLTKNREPDLSFITTTALAMQPYLKEGQLIVLESTTYPGTTRDVFVPLLEATGLRSEHNIFVAYSPEREDPGNKTYATHSIPKVIGGHGPLAATVAEALYQQAVNTTVLVSSADVAEAVKLTENIFRSVNIALVNELKVIYDAMGIDIWEVIEAAKTKPFGYMPFYPGPGLGGHCIPIDPFYLTWKAREHELNTKFIELAGEINTKMPYYVVGKLTKALDEQFQTALSNASILLIGLAYKKNVDDIRESPTFKILDLLSNRVKNVDYHDPFVPSIPKTREHATYMGKTSVPLTPETVATYDAVVIVTDHDCINYTMLGTQARLIIDTRNAMKNTPDDRRGKIIKA